jgi:autotransporter-associated beta strand protein
MHEAFGFQKMLKLSCGRAIFPGLICAALFVGEGRAATLTWDANGTTGPNPSDGSGTWLTANAWWDGSANVNGSWSGAIPDSAIFGAGMDGSYSITVGTVTANAVIVTNSNYTLSGGTLTLPSGGAIVVASNQVATVSANIFGSNVGQNWTVNSNATLNVSGNVQGMQVMWQGSGTVNLSGTNTPSIFWVDTTVNQTAGSMTPGVYSFVGYQSPQNLPGTLTLSGSAALTVNGGDLTIGRGGNSGTMTIQGGVANIGTTSMRSLNLALDNNNANSATLNVSGGTLNVGTNGVASMIQIMPGGGSIQERAAINISGGTVNAQGIQFGSANTYSGGAATLALSGGNLFIGSQGIIKGANRPATSSIILSGGTIGALSDWSCAMDLVLGNSGSVTIQAADGSGVGHNILLAGNISGNGALVKTGGGMLTLTGANSYNGGTTVSAGTLDISTTNNVAMPYAINGATLGLQIGAPATSLQMSSLTLSGASVFNMDANAFGNPTAPVINVTGALVPTGPVTINVSGAALGAGQFPLIKYGSMGGLGFAAFTLGTVSMPNGSLASVSLVDNSANKSIDLDISIQTLTWAGTVNGNWDLTGTANWQTNAFFTENNGVGPIVQFDDTAPGTTTIVLNTTVKPIAVIARNSTLTYRVDGTGGIGGSASVVKQGAGRFSLSGAHTYNGVTSIQGGTLALVGTASIANTPTIEVESNATFDVSGLASTFTLGANQTLSNGVARGCVDGNLDASVGRISMAYASDPPLIISNGTFSLSGSTTVTIDTRDSLTIGNYKLIARATVGNPGLVTGTVPPVDITGSGVVFGATPSLVISNSELYLAVSYNAVDSTSLNNKVMAGYQGWFRTPGDVPGNNGWSHWFNSNPPSVGANNLGFDAWPDVSELPPAEKYGVPGFINADGSQAFLYSARNYATVLRHFQWMQEAGIDGVWLSQFCSHMPGGASQSDYPNVTNVMNNVRKAATATGRTWAFMYDFSGLNTNNVVTLISNQWVNMVNSGITSDPRYLHHDGQPVLLLWGFFPDRIWSQPQYCLPLINFLQAPGPYQAAVVGGGAANWRTTGTPEFIAMLMRLTAWQPWQVGHYTSGGATAITSSWPPDLAMCTASNVLFIPVLFSGTHIAGPPPIPPALPNAPRRNGNFLWEQFVAVSSLSRTNHGAVSSVFVAMFDEVNEGTEIMKVSNFPPTNAAFITYEGATGDWYLRLVGLGESMLRKGIPITTTIPISPFSTNLFYKIINRATGLLLNSAGSLSSGSPLAQYANTNGDPNLQWQLLYDGAGYFKIKNRASGKVISNGGSITENAPVVQVEDANTDDVKWFMNWDGTGCCRVTSKTSSKTLSGQGAATNFTQVVQVTDAANDNLRWQILEDDAAVVLQQAPVVNFSRADSGGETFHLTWPVSSTLYSIEMATNLNPPVFWSPWTNPVFINISTNSASIIPDRTNRFFRLRRL